jgi:hypothetical protein
VLDRVLSNADVFGLQRVCDAYVSLHRSEGLGLGMAECMAQGKPVIATAYSGNLEFMTESNSCLVDYALVPVRPGEYIDYEPGGCGRIRTSTTPHGTWSGSSPIRRTGNGSRSARQPTWRTVQPSRRGAGHRPAPCRARALQRGRDAQSRSIAMA